MKDTLRADIYRQLNIPNFGEPARIAHAAYSVAGKMALASLWDNEENAPYISPQHFKSRAQEVLDAFSSIFPGTADLFPEDKAEVADEIYKRYLRAGHFYHSDKKLYPCAEAIAQVEKTRFHRGSSPGNVLHMSGLGFYSLTKDVNQNGLPLARVLGLPETTLDDFLKEVLEGGGKWLPVQWPEGTEFLRLRPPFSRGYWQGKPETDGTISLARFGELSKTYVLYRFENGQMLRQEVPEWFLKDFRSDSLGNHGDPGGYRRIAAALLLRNHTLPLITHRTIGDYVRIDLGYRLPPEEEDFFLLYTWPLAYVEEGRSNHTFRGMMSSSVFPVFKAYLESTGYHFEEV